MEAAQVQQLKLNATNIKSVLIKSNTELRKIRLKKRDLINAEIDREKKLEKEKKLESGIKSSLNRVKNAVFTGPMNIFDKIMEFAGIILFGMVVNNLPAIISGLEKFFNENSVLITAITESLGFVAESILGLSKMVSNLPGSKQNKIISDRNAIDNKLVPLKKSLDALDVTSKANDLKKALNPATNPATNNTPNSNQNSSQGNQRPVQRAKGGSIPTRQPQTTKSTSPTFTAGETGRAKRARQTTNYFGTFNQAVKDSSDNSITDEKNIDLFEKMSNNFKKFSEFMQTSMMTPPGPGGPGAGPGDGIAIDVDPDEIIGYVGSTGHSTGPHIHFENLTGAKTDLPSSVRDNILVGGRPLSSYIQTSGPGPRWGTNHAGEDWSGGNIDGKPITLTGGLKFVEYNTTSDPGGYGNYVVIQSGKAQYLLGHLSGGPRNISELKKRQNQQQQNLGNFVPTGKESSGKASFYGGPTDRYWEGRQTRSGERFDSNLMTAASNTIALGTYVRVTNNNNGKSVIVKINDIGGFGSLGRILDLSAGAMRELGGINAGVIPVKVEVLKRKAQVTPPPSQVTANGRQQLISSTEQISQPSVIFAYQQYQTFVPMPYALPGQTVDTSLPSLPSLSSIWKP